MSFPIELKRPLVVFDIESTGVSPRRDRIIELAAVKLYPDGREEERCWLLNPTVHIPDETTSIHGISDADVARCPTFADRNGCFRWKNGEWTINFGKKRGESLKRIMIEEPNFLRWFTKGDFETDARMIAADALEGRLPPAPDIPPNVAK